MSTTGPHDVTFLDWLRLGALGPVRLGLSRAEVLAALGEPEDWSVTSRRRRKPAILKWGDLEFHFAEDDLFLIYTDAFDRGGPLSGGRAFRVRDAARFTRATTPEDLQNRLHAAGVPFTVSSPPPENRAGSLTLNADGTSSLSDVSFVVTTRPGVRAVFHSEEGGPPWLASLEAMAVS